jgi:hypothetical protein
MIRISKVTCGVLVTGLILMSSWLYAVSDQVQTSTYTVTMAKSKSSKPKPKPKARVLKFTPPDTTHGQILSPGEKAPMATLDSTSSEK